MCDGDARPLHIRELRCATLRQGNYELRGQPRRAEADRRPVHRPRGLPPAGLQPVLAAGPVHRPGEQRQQHDLRRGLLHGQCPGKLAE